MSRHSSFVAANISESACRWSESVTSLTRLVSRIEGPWLKSQRSSTSHSHRKCCIVIVHGILVSPPSPPVAGNDIECRGRMEPIHDQDEVEDEDEDEDEGEGEKQEGE